MNKTICYRTALYCRLSKDDDQSGESISIGTQRAILEDYCREQGYPIHKVYIDDGYSGTNFNRPGFQELLDDVERRTVNLVITKDLSRLGRDYIMTGYYSEIYFPSKGVRYIAVADNFDSLKNDNDIAPFKNILNDMYARDISRKIKNAKRQRAKNGLQRLAQPPYGYRMNPDIPSRLIIDPEPAEVVRLIFSLTLEGMGQIAITKELAARKIVAPSVHKHRQGDTRFSGYGPVTDGDPYRWSSATIGSILRNCSGRVKIATLRSERNDQFCQREIANSPGVVIYLFRYSLSAPAPELLLCWSAGPGFPGVCRGSPRP